MSRVRERVGDGLNPHKEGGQCGFPVKPICLSASFSKFEIFIGLYNFPDTHAVLVITTHAYVYDAVFLLPVVTMQFTLHFHWDICVLIPLGNRSIYIYASTQFTRHVKRGLQVNIHHMSGTVVMKHIRYLTNVTL